VKLFLREPLVQPELCFGFAKHQFFIRYNEYLRDYQAQAILSPFCPFFLEMKKIDFYTALPYDNYNDFY